MTAAQLAQTLLAPWRQRDRSAPWGRRAIAALVLLSTVASLTLLEGPVRWAVPGGVMLIVFHGAWMMVGFSLQEQNHPNAARCVPGQLQTLRVAALLGWAGFTALATAACWVMLPPGLGWQPMLLVNAVVTVFTLWSLRAWWLWIAMTFGGPLLGALRAQLEPLAQAALSLWQTNTPGVLALALLALAGLVSAIFGNGDARHRRVYERQRAMRQAQRLQMQGKAVSPAEALGGLDTLSRPFDALLWAWRRHVLVHADNRRVRSVMARAELVLHGNQHWTYQLLALVSLTAFLAALTSLVLVFTSVPGAELMRHGSFGIAIGLGSALLQPALARSQALWQSRREQALLRLLPGVPQGTALNRAVAWMGLRHALVVCLIFGATMLPLAWVSDNMLPVWMAVAALPWAVWAATRSPARMQAPSALTAAVPMFLCFMSAVIAQTACQVLGLPLVAAAGSVLVVSVLWGRWRWLQLDAQPTALPAGRLA